VSQSLRPAAQAHLLATQARIAAVFMAPAAGHALLHEPQ
jgi:hypothetical protein